MAASRIPGAGWGVYTGHTVLAGETIHPREVAVQVSDYPHYRRFRQDHPHPPAEKIHDNNNHNNHNPNIPGWLLHEYYWRSSITSADFDADDVDSVLPGFGMLANSHTGLINAANDFSDSWRRT
jgi:hypothetical protein